MTEAYFHSGECTLYYTIVQISEFGVWPAGAMEIMKGTFIYPNLCQFSHLSRAGKLYVVIAIYCLFCAARLSLQLAILK
jgi:hypothetical protein